MKKYWETIYSCQLLLVPSICACAGIYYTICKYMGQYPDTPWFMVCIFDINHIIYTLIAIILWNTKKNTLETLFSTRIKKFVTITLFIQFNFIIHLFPNYYTWGCIFVFLMFIMMFDFKFVIFNSILYTLSIICGYIIHWDKIVYKKSGYIYNIIFCIILYCVYLIFSFVTSYFIEKAILYIQKEEEETKILNQRQLEYYENLDLMDTELRKFRHDITNHFCCIGNLLESNHIDELKKYFNDLSLNYQENTKIYLSGNVIIDSLLNYGSKYLCNNNVNLVIFGKLPEIKTVSSMDICTIFSNMLSNTIKGANSLDRASDIEIQFKSGESYFFIQLTNDYNKYNENISADKAKDRNHGYGIEKIDEITSKYNGIFEQKIINNKFIMQIYLPI